MMLKYLSGFTLNFWLVVVGALFAGLAIQTVRIEGFKMWPIHIVGFKEEVYTLTLDLNKIKDAQILAKERAESEKLRIENDYLKKAEKADAEYQTSLASAHARADAYARRMRVRAPGGAPGGTAGTSEGGSAEGSDGPGENAFVAISRSDFDTLNENTIRLQQAHEWALSLNEIAGE